MPQSHEYVEKQYGIGSVLDNVVKGLTTAGKDVDRLTPADLAPVDQFHMRGREATTELADMAALTPGIRVLDVGCGLGGSARYLASERGCLAWGIDLTKEYVEAAKILAQWVGLSDKVEFHHGSAVALPFADASFNVVWTEHTQMNIEDKGKLYEEFFRVLKPGGRVALHDVFEGEPGGVYYPVPWANEPSGSFLVSVDAMKEVIQTHGFRIVVWKDDSAACLEWFAAMSRKTRESGPSPLGLHLLMGETARLKSQNLVRNLQEKRLTAIQAVLEKI